MLVGTAMTFDAVLEVPDTLLDVFAPDLLGRVLVATVAGIAAVVVADMACHAFYVVIAIQSEILVVIECHRHPLLLGMALAAIALDLLMQCVGRRLVAGLTFRASIGLQQRMVKSTFDTESLHACMVAMAGEALLFQEFLMEWRARQRFLDCLPTGRDRSNLFRFVAGRATFGSGTG